MGKNHGTMCEIPLVLYLLTYKQRLWKLVPFDFQDNLMHGLTKKIMVFHTAACTLSINAEA